MRRQQKAILGTRTAATLNADAAFPMHRCCVIGGGRSTDAPPAPPPVVREMPRTKNIPRRSEVGVHEQQRATAALAAASAPAPRNDAIQVVGGAGASGVSVEEEEEEEEEVEEDEEETLDDGQRRDRLALAPVSARVPAPGPRPDLAAAPAHLPLQNNGPPRGAGASGVTLEKQEVEEESLGQLRDQGLAPGSERIPPPGPRAARVLIKVEDSTSGEDTDGDGEGEGAVGTGGGEGGGEGEEEVPGGEGAGLLLLGGAANDPGDDGERGEAPRRSNPADTAALAKRGRGEVAAVDDAPAPKRQTGGAQVGKSGHHGVTEVDTKNIKKATPWLKWRADLCVPGGKRLPLGLFPTVDDAARAYDAEVRRRGWEHVRRLNFPQPEELAAYTPAGERCDERGLPLTLAPEPQVATQGSNPAQGASGQLAPTLSAQKPGMSGFYGVSPNATNNEAEQWKALMSVHGAGNNYAVGYFATKEEAARAYDAEVRRRGWAHLKRLNYPNLADGESLPPSSSAARAPHDIDSEESASEDSDSEDGDGEDSDSDEGDSDDNDGDDDNDASDDGDHDIGATTAGIAMTVAKLPPSESYDNYEVGSPVCAENDMGVRTNRWRPEGRGGR